MNSGIECNALSIAWSKCINEWCLCMWFTILSLIYYRFFCCCCYHPLSVSVIRSHFQWLLPLTWIKREKHSKYVDQPKDTIKSEEETKTKNKNMCAQVIIVHDINCLHLSHMGHYDGVVFILMRMSEKFALNFTLTKNLLSFIFFVLSNNWECICSKCGLCVANESFRWVCWFFLLLSKHIYICLWIVNIFFPRFVLFSVLVLLFVVHTLSLPI